MEITRIPCVSSPFSLASEESCGYACMHTTSVNWQCLSTQLPISILYLVFTLFHSLMFNPLLTFLSLSLLAHLLTVLDTLLKRTSPLK